MADPAPTQQDVNLAILSALGQLTASVDALGEKLAHQAEPPSAPAEFIPFEMSQDHGYAPLVAANADNELGRFKLAQSMGILGAPAGEELLARGARGWYRRLDRSEGQLIHEIYPRDIRMALVIDADSEDSREAIDMATDLLPVLADDPQTGVSIPVLDN